jgi:Holliday junction resolvase RusA-like endonuclease
MTFTFNITPIGKPRMVRSDAWRGRKCVIDYWEYKDELVRQAREQDFTLPSIFAVTFHIPMPSSWSQKKKDRMRGQPHTQKPDIDNICKAIMDCLLPDDSSVWSIHAEKYWSDVGRIEIAI